MEARGQAFGRGGRHDCFGVYAVWIVFLPEKIGYNMHRDTKERGDFVHQRLAKALLEDIYYPVSAAVSIGEKGEILGVHLFDTLFCGDHMRVETDAAEFWLISLHNDGSRTLYDADLQNLRRMRQLAGGRRIRMFLASEEYACREIGLSEDLLHVL